MQSKKFSINGTLFIKDMKRAWPVSLALCFMLLADFIPRVISAVERADKYGEEIKNIGIGFSTLSVCVACYLAVLLIFGFLHNSRSTNFFMSLPVSRGSLFATKVLSCFIIVLAPVFVFSVGVFAAYGFRNFIVNSLISMLLSTICFAGMAVLTAVLIGQTVAFAAISFITQIVGYAMRYLCADFLSNALYGFTDSNFYADSYVLSPAMHFIDRGNRYSPEIMRMSLLLAIFGAACVIAACFAFTRRKAETSGDIITFRWLRPVFKYAVTVCASYSFTVVMLNAFSISKITHGHLPLICALVIAGAAIGYFVSEMLMRKTFFVFKKTYKGLLIAAALLIVFPVAAEMDVLGVENKVPELNSIEYVTMQHGKNLAEPETVEKVLELHRYLIGKKAVYEAFDPGLESAKIVIDSAGTEVYYPNFEHYSVYQYAKTTWEQRNLDARYPQYIRIDYNLKNGKKMHRYYDTWWYSKDQAALDGLGEIYFDISRSYEWIYTSIFPDESVRPINFENLTADLWAVEQEINYNSSPKSPAFDNKQAILLYEAVISDMREGNIGIDEYSPPFPAEPDTLLSNNLLFYEKCFYDRDVYSDGVRTYPEYFPGTVLVKEYTQYHMIRLDSRAEKTLGVLESLGYAKLQ